MPLAIEYPKTLPALFEGVREMKDTVTYPLSAIMDEEEESRIDQLERELAEAKKDADRYRYVRSIWGLPDEKFNDEIDAAMKEGGK